jgi:hypothetical protein
MGLSSSTSKTKTTSNTSQNTNQTESGTTTPITPDWLTNAASDYVDRIGSFGQMDPNSFVAPSSPLQNMAWNNASSLGDWRGQAATAAQMAAGAGQGGALGGAMGLPARGASRRPDERRLGADGGQPTRRGQDDAPHRQHAPARRSVATGIAAQCFQRRELAATGSGLSGAGKQLQRPEPQHARPCQRAGLFRASAWTGRQLCGGAHRRPDRRGCAGL